MMKSSEEDNSCEVSCITKESSWNKGVAYESTGASVFFLTKVLRENNFKVKGGQ